MEGSTVTMVSNATCLRNYTAVAPPFVVNINPQPAPQMNITSYNPSAVLCPQQICLFTQLIIPMEVLPIFQLNLTSNVGTNSPLFTAANPSGLISVYVTSTPSTGCSPQQSNIIAFNIQPSSHPEITLTADVLDSICPGEEVHFRNFITHRRSSCL